MKRKTVEHMSLCVQPTFLIGTYNEDGVPNFCPITWVSVTWDDDHYLLILSMNGKKKTKDNIAREGVLTANLVSTDMLDLLDYFGHRTALDGPKDGIRYECEEALSIHAPTLKKSRFIYECQVEKIVPWVDTDTYFCRILKVQALEGATDDSLTDLMALDLMALDPVIYSGNYYSLARRLGEMGEFDPLKAQ